MSSGGSIIGHSWSHDQPFFWDTIRTHNTQHAFPSLLQWQANPKSLSLTACLSHSLSSSAEFFSNFDDVNFITLTLLFLFCNLFKFNFALCFQMQCKFLSGGFGDNLAGFKVSTGMLCSFICYIYIVLNIYFILSLCFTLWWNGIT